MSLSRSSEYYRNRAETLRLAATDARSPDNRETLRMLAADFDELANEVEAEDLGDRADG
jgi:hypothetical protein